GADVLAHQVGFRHRHIEFRRRLGRIARRIFDYQTFLTGMRMRGAAFGRPGARADWQHLQPDVTPNAVLQMDDIVAFFQLGEIYVQRRTRRLRVWRFQAAWPLHLVTPKDFRVCYHHQLRFVIQKPARQRTEVNLGTLDFGLRTLDFRPRTQQAIFLPDFAETLSLTVIVAKHMHAVTLPQPAM